MLSNILEMLTCPDCYFHKQFQENLAILCLPRCEKEFTPLIDMQGKKAECQRRARMASWIPKIAKHIAVCSALRQANICVG